MADRASLVGVVPAAGAATRLGRLPCSKEIFPVGFASDADGRVTGPKVAGHYLLERMRLAGVRTAYVVLGPGKWDIPAYFGDGSLVGMDLAYLVVEDSPGPPHTVDRAYPFVRDARVVFGFPDILFEPADAFARLLDEQAATGADVVLGLFPAETPQKVDMVDVGAGGVVTRIDIKPARTELALTWASAVWTPAFTAFLHDHLARLRPAVHVGTVVQAALDGGLRVGSVTFDRGRCRDIGTPDDLRRAVAAEGRPR